MVSQINDVKKKITGPISAKVHEGGGGGTVEPVHFKVRQF